MEDSVAGRGQRTEDLEGREGREPGFTLVEAAEFKLVSRAQTGLAVVQHKATGHKLQPTGYRHDSTIVLSCVSRWRVVVASSAGRRVSRKC